MGIGVGVGVGVDIGVGVGIGIGVGVGIGVVKFFVKVAVTDLFEPIVILQDPKPVQAPPQPEKVEFASCCAYRVIEDPLR